jgi:hypothetical protein
MSQYQASIGRSSYEIPYESHEDLPLLKTLCKDVNRLVNSVIASNPTFSNEYAILLALINIIYESNQAKASSDDSTIVMPHGNQYSTQDILEIISFLQSKI